MPPHPCLHVLVLTPHAVIAELDVDGLRVPSDTGQVGLRPRGEPTVLAVEPGLALVRTGTTLRFLGTAGGLVRSDGRSVLEALTAALAIPDPERDLRLAIERLHTGIITELRRAERVGGPDGRAR